MTSKTLPLTQLEDLSETRLAQKISQQPGVGLVSMSGGQRPAMRVQVNPAALAAYGLNIDDVRTILGNANVNIPKGNFDGPSQASTIGANDQITTAQGYADQIIAYRNGAPVRLSDVAKVVSGAENSKLAAWAGNARRRSSSMSSASRAPMSSPPSIRCATAAQPARPACRRR